MRACSILVFLFSATIVSNVAADPVVLILKDYTNGTNYQVNNVEEGGSLYVASNDAVASLNNIQLVTGGKPYLLSDLAAVQPDGIPQKITISGGLTITTTNTDSATNALTGYLYVTTAQQAQDPSFGVYVITGTHNIVLSGAQATTVILNTELVTPPDDVDRSEKTTYVSDLKMDIDKTVIFQWGIPGKQATNNQFFRNPFNYNNYDSNGNLLNTTQLFFDHVEPLQIGLDYWYISSSGSVSMTMKNTYVPNHNYTTTAVSTTGLVVSGTFLFNQHTVNFQQDPVNTQTFGSLISAYPSPRATVSFVFNGSDENSVQNYDIQNNATQLVKVVKFSAQTLTVSSSDVSAGTFYCQYFSNSNAGTPMTTTVATSGATVPQGSTVTAGTGPTQAAGSTLTTAFPPGSTVSTVNAGTVTTVTAGSPTTSSATVATTTSVVRSPFSFFSFFVVLTLLIL
ncbi:Protein CBG13564 [Caenorhabditis briggsae]|uniref:Protein CBG13564 n=1 Tax=Caenorhabditis briggsae TaxID=6238 RepID=A8XI70_CAEBR|nr:Protein CBG13564 [Caenorhabditis briggsae]CAP32344.2 Protein CBG13564 [Caenorhabditis briggsae]